MTDPLFVHKLLVFLIDIAALALGAMVYMNNPKGKINKVFVLMVVLMLFWVNFAFLSRLFQESVFLKPAWFVTPLFFTFLYFMVVYLLEKEKEYQILNRFVLVAGGLIAAVTGFTDSVIEGIKVVNGDLTIIYGQGMFPFLAIIVFLVLATLIPLFRGYFKSSFENRSKIEYFLIGIFIFYLGNVIFNITFPIFLDINHYYYLGDYSSIFLLGFIAYAIVTRELFGIKVILSQTLVGVIAVLLLWQATAATSLFDFAWKIALFFLFLIFGFFLIKSVIQEIKRRAELQRLYKKVDNLSKAKSEFISIASHQLRTPLTAVKGYISMIREGTYGKPDKKLIKPLDNVYQSNERLIKLVNDLLNLSRLEAGRIDLRPKSASLEKLVESVVKEMEINTRKKKLYINIKKPSKSLPEAVIDEDKMRQVVLNILDNAIKYTKTGGITIEILKVDSMERIRITDTGEGMSREEMKGIFDMFSRAKAGARYHAQGAGVGLYVAAKFVDMHKGKIWAESRGEGKGSTFFVEVPIRG